MNHPDRAGQCRQRLRFAPPRPAYAVRHRQAGAAHRGRLISDRPHCINPTLLGCRIETPFAQSIPRIVQFIGVVDAEVRGPLRFILEQGHIHFSEIFALAHIFLAGPLHHHYPLHPLAVITVISVGQMRNPPIRENGLRLIRL